MTWHGESDRHSEVKNKGKLKDTLRKPMTMQDKSIAIKELARKYDTVEDFIEASQKNFMIARYRRACNNQRRLSADDFNGEEKTTVWRTGEKQIDIGDYVYVDKTDAQHALSIGQGKRLYSKNIKTNELIQAGLPEGEFFYSPLYLKKYDGLEDLWKEANGIPIIKEKKKEKSIDDLGEMAIEALKWNMEFGKQEWLKNRTTKEITKEYHLTKAQLLDIWNKVHSK